MRQVIVKGGQAVVEETPAPVVAPGRVLVATRVSCISVGTELSGLKAQRDPLWKVALKNPDKVARALQMMATQGVGQTFRVVKETQASGIAVGYSAAGEVLEVGAGVELFAPGDLVACAGAGYAMHADVISVPENLVTAVPDGVSLKAASTVTLGAIALQGVRRLEPTLGETFVVVGLGILGQITVALLKANGCRVIGVDVDATRVERAKDLGAAFGLTSADALPVDSVHRLTRGVGADGVIVTAAANNTQLLNASFAMCRRKGRVVLVGDVPITIDRAAIYKNELEFLISTSYGPGRYDAQYEEHGYDYPVGYVRWTESRNMDAYLQLIASGSLQPDALIELEAPVENAPSAYAALANPNGNRPLAVALLYGGGSPPTERKVAIKRQAVSAASDGGVIGVGLVGASAFARTVHLPNLRALDGPLKLLAVCGSVGHQTKDVAASAGAAYATTRLEELLEDPQIKLLLLAGRHDQHARQVLAGLNAGKHVFAEKPLALSEDELAPIEAFYGRDANDAGAKPMLLTGFNRRFAPAVDAIRKRTAHRTGPMVITYRMNAGFIPHSHWTQTAEGGGRNLGEACHIYDLFTALTGAAVERSAATAIGREDERTGCNENFAASFTFADGSLANLVYTSVGDSRWPKEQMEIFCDGQVLFLDNYTEVSCGSVSFWKGTQDKGHRAELEAVARCLVDGGSWPIPLWQQLQATRMSFEVERLIYQRGDSSQTGN